MTLCTPSNLDGLEHARVAVEFGTYHWVGWRKALEVLINVSLEVDVSWCWRWCVNLPDVLTLMAPYRRWGFPRSGRGLPSDYWWTRGHPRKVLRWGRADRGPRPGCRATWRQPNPHPPHTPDPAPERHFDEALQEVFCCLLPVFLPPLFLVFPRLPPSPLPIHLALLYCSSSFPIFSTPVHLLSHFPLPLSLYPCPLLFPLFLFLPLFLLFINPCPSSHSFSHPCVCLFPPPSLPSPFLPSVFLLPLHSPLSIPWLSHSSPHPLFFLPPSFIQLLGVSSDSPQTKGPGFWRRRRPYCLPANSIRRSILEPVTLPLLMHCNNRTSRKHFLTPISICDLSWAWTLLILSVPYRSSAIQDPGEGRTGPAVVCAVSKVER